MSKTTQILTVGYEGKEIEFFFNLIKKSGVKQLIDIRYNPISRKRGFSKTAISLICASQGIYYNHIRGLGIPSNLRKQFTEQEREGLLLFYRDSLLPCHMDELNQAICLIAKMPSALLCFEKDVNCCHRSMVAKAISAKTGYKIINL